MRAGYGLGSAAAEGLAAAADLRKPSPRERGQEYALMLRANAREGRKQSS